MIIVGGRGVNAWGRDSGNDLNQRPHRLTDVSALIISSFRFRTGPQITELLCAVYFDQRMGAVHSKCSSKYHYLCSAPCA